MSKRGELMTKILILIVAVCIDCFAAAIGLGSAGIKIPVKSALIISSVGTLFLILSVSFADVISCFIPLEICRIISFVLLIALGLFNIFQNTLKRAVNNKKSKNTNPVTVFCDETAADVDNSKTISPKEALPLAIALSADSIITGISAGFASYNLILLTVMTLFIGLISIIYGCKLGEKIISTRKINLGWICGVMLIVLAFLK